MGGNERRRSQGQGQSGRRAAKASHRDWEEEGGDKKASTWRRVGQHAFGFSSISGGTTTAMIVFMTSFWDFCAALVGDILDRPVKCTFLKTYISPFPCPLIFTLGDVFWYVDGALMSHLRWQARPDNHSHVGLLFSESSSLKSLRQKILLNRRS